MRYVGFSSEFHDAGLSIIEEDGSVSFATHSERYSKVKSDPRLSYKLMELIKDDDVVTFYEDVSIRSKMHNLRKEVFPDELREMSKSLTNKLIHSPTSAIRQASRAGRREIISNLKEIYEISDLNTAKRNEISKKTTKE